MACLRSHTGSFAPCGEVLGSSNHMTILLVVHKGQHVASSILLKFGEMVVSDSTRDTGEFRNLGVNPILRLGSHQIGLS